MDPQNLTANASLNRVRIVDLPGVRLGEEDIKGKLAFDLLSAGALAKCIGQQAGQLLLPDADLSQLPLLLDHCFESESKAARQAAESIARRYGRRLGYLIATLKRGDEINRQARPQWDDSYWQQWAVIREIRLGGGLVSGHLGQQVVQYAQEALESAYVYDCTVSLSEFPYLLPLIGAARSTPTDNRAMLVFDFGGTYAKRAHAFYNDGTLTSLKVLPRQAVRRAEPVAGEEGEEYMYNKALSLAEQMVITMADTWQQAVRSGLDLSPRIVAAIASYMVNGRPEFKPERALQRATPPSLRYRNLVYRGPGQPPRPAYCYHLPARRYSSRPSHRRPSYKPHSRDFLGTALGVGFPPSTKGLRPIAQPLAVS